MDLIYTDAKWVDQGVLHAYTLDLSFGADEAENDFELTLGKSEPALADGALIYMEGTEYGGMVGGLRSSSGNETRVATGRTWHGILNSKVLQPDAGQDHLTVSGEANAVLNTLISRMGLTALFSASEANSGITISGYSFPRYCKGYAALEAMLGRHGGKLKMRWKAPGVELYAERIVNYTDLPIAGDQAALTVERHAHKVNHLICLGAGQLAQRQVLHLYADADGNISESQHYFGLEEVTEIYDYANAVDAEELRSEGLSHFRELRAIDKVDVTALEGAGFVYDIGDVIGGADETSGNEATATITQKIVKINNGAVSIDYKTGR